jgi:hypothetical protein
VDLYGEFVRTTTGSDPPAALLDLLRDVLEEAADASA